MHPSGTHPPVAVSSRVKAIASVLATPCQNSEVTPTADNIRIIRQATLCLINQERARNDELPLKLNRRLELAAQRHSDRMVSEDYFDHISPSGETPLQRVTATGYIPNDLVGYVIGENIAWGTLQDATPQSTVEAWIASPGHLANILDTRYIETGIGIDPQAPLSLSEGSPGATYTQDFGVLIS